ncbi:MAG: glycosyltransferase family 9 protein [Elusimicrobiota bacterium]|nr:glycosyltransferase family 9 protein [Elusimicrobiota bacterium]
MCEVKTGMKIAVFHMNQLGDMMFSLPMLYNLRQAYPEAQIVSISKSSSIIEFNNLTSLINKTIIRPSGFNIQKKISFLMQCKSEQFDLSIHISQSIDSTLTAFFANIPQRIGFETAPLSFLYTKKVEFANPPSIANNFRLIEPLNVKISKTDYVGLLSVKPDEEYLKNIGVTKRDTVVVIAPGTSKRRKYKMWSEEKFGGVTKYLCEKYLAKCFIVGSKDDYTTCQNICNDASMRNLAPYISGGARVSNFAGKTSLKDLCRIFQRANLFIGIDSGAMHIAASVDIPIIALFGTTNPNVVGPQNKNSVVIKRNSTSEITVEDVISAIESLPSPILTRLSEG